MCAPGGFSDIVMAQRINRIWVRSRAVRRHRFPIIGLPTDVSVRQTFSPLLESLSGIPLHQARARRRYLYVQAGARHGRQAAVRRTGCLDCRATHGLPCSIFWHSLRHSIRAPPAFMQCTSQFMSTKHITLLSPCVNLAPVWFLVPRGYAVQVHGMYVPSCVSLAA